MTPQLFTSLSLSTEVNTRIAGYRQRLPELAARKAEIERLREMLEPIRKSKAQADLAQAAALRAQIKALSKKQSEITTLKTGLPGLMYQVSQFDLTESRNGNPGRWRKQTAARLNGLFMLDIDHVADPKAVVRGWVERSMAENPGWYLPEMTAAQQRAEFFDRMGIVLCHITTSGQGLRLVCKANGDTGNIADNQVALADSLQVKRDKACIDASRCSFCPGFDDILYINKEELFNYEDKEFDRRYGPRYRGGNSQPAAAGSQDSRQPHTNTTGAAPDGSDQGNRENGAVAAVVPGSEREAERLDDVLTKGYHGVSYEKIINEWYNTVSKGRPDAGDRHRTLLAMAGDLRYTTDNKPELLARVLKISDTGRELCDEGREQEITKIATDACARQMWKNIPKRLQPVLEAAGVQLDAAGADHGDKEPAPVDYEAWWRRLDPLLQSDPLLAKIVSPLPPAHRLAGVLAAGAMLGTYLTRCWWAHFDGKDYRLSFLVNIIGDAASGKSFVTELDRLLMAPMLAADRVGREYERQYKEDMKKRAASSKNARQEAPDQQHPVIRYVPSTVSNAMLYRRLTDAVDANTMGPDGQPMHLHVYTMEPELATALRAQVGSWAGKNDLELKSFHNEYAGVDFANDQSVNGIIQVNWNQVVTGTWESMSRKIKPAMVLDGLVTRLILFPMPSNEYQMIERRSVYRDNDRQSMMRSLGLKLEDVKGELKASRMVDYCYQYEEQLTNEARIEQDKCLDYFRKRIPVIMMRYGLVRLVIRHTDLALRGEPLPVDDSDLEFCRLIGDWCLMTQMNLYGQMVMDAKEREKQNFVPRRRSRKIRNLYASLPEEFNLDMLKKDGANDRTCYVTISRWVNDGLVAMTGDRTYRKIFEEIPV